MDGLFFSAGGKEGLSGQSAGRRGNELQRGRRHRRPGALRDNAAGKDASSCLGIRQRVATRLPIGLAGSHGVSQPLAERFIEGSVPGNAVAAHAALEVGEPGRLHVGKITGPVEE